MHIYNKVIFTHSIMECELLLLLEELHFNMAQSISIFWVNNEN